jgi:colicin import membrane protein
VGIGLVLFVALLGGNAWHKQRQAERAAAEQRAAEQKAREAERLQEERRAAERRQLERQADPGRDQGLAELRALEQQRLAEERDLRLRQTEQRASEVEAALKRLEAERARDQAALKARPPTNAYRERPPREREERPGGGGDVEELRRKTEADFRLADGNGDGFVTREEAQGRMPFLAKEFQRVDTDGDGRVSPHELMQFRQEMLSRFRKP